MRQKQFIAVAIAMVTMILSSCGTSKNVKNQPDTMPAPSVAAVTANPEIVSIPEVITMLDNPTSVSEVAKKYGYKQVNGYEIYHFDKFSKLFYKNCRLAKVITEGKYEDYPKPLKKGISSYIAFKDDAIIIGVFNKPAYDNLVAQVKAAGFVLDMPGNEDVYKKGTHTIGCLESAKIISIR